MDITGIVRSIEPVFTTTHELARATFHIDGATQPFIAFGTDAERVYQAAFATGRAHIVAASCVTLTNNVRAYLVDSIDIAQSA